MIKFSHPHFISFELNKKSVYSSMIYDEPIDSQCYNVDTAKSLIRTLNNNSPIGLSLYGDIIDTNILDDFIQACKDNNISLGYDIACNESMLKQLRAYYEEFELFRIILYSLNEKVNNSFDPNNKLSCAKSFIKEISNFKVGKVIVIPVVHENIREIEDLIDFSLKSGFHANPLPLPVNCALNLKSTPLSKKEFIELSNIIAKYYSIYKDGIYLDMPTAYKIINKPSVCPAFRLSVDISSLGQIRYCKFYNQELGHIANLDSIWQSKNITLPQKCNICEIKDKCYGGCIANLKGNGKCDINCLF